MKENKSSKSTRRRFLKKCSIALSVAGMIGSVGEIGYQIYIYRHRQIFGTRENPAYTITAKIPDIDIDSYSSYIQGRNQYLDKRLAKLRSSRVPEIETKIETEIKEKSTITQEKYEKVKENVRKVFKIMTGKDMPRKISLNIEDIVDEMIEGHYEEISGKTVSQALDEAGTENTLTHEVGHAINQQSEYQVHGVLFPWFWSRESRVLEEAGAYAFERCAGYFEQDETLAKEMRRQIRDYSISLIEGYFRGEKEYHREAIVIADATITCFNDPIKAFNHLSTTPLEQLDPSIGQIIYINKMQFEYSVEKEQEIKNLNQRLRSTDTGNVT